MDAAQKSTIRPLLLIAVIISGSIAMATVLIVRNIICYDPGTQLASLDVRSGEPFELRFISNGKIFMYGFILSVMMFVSCQCEMVLMTGGSRSNPWKYRPAEQT
jgi:hypothetical protein